MSTPGDVKPCIADHDRRWLPTGRDGVWPDRGIDGAQWPTALALLAKLGFIDKENSRPPAIDRLCRRSGHDARLSETPDVAVKSP